MRMLDSERNSMTSDAKQMFAARVIAWQKRAGRHALPWQNTNDPYRIWLSEIMLQQTQVKTVVPYYESFLREFPTLESLASASLERVLQSWSGLGYYARARNLHACAQQVVREFAGQFPKDPEQLETLSGIGRSTAAAIAAFAFGSRATILDGNVRRVLCRVFGIDGYPGSNPVLRQLWDLAEALAPREEIQAYSQGLMDLGAEVCTPRRPQCAECPLNKSCAAVIQQRVQALPTRRTPRVLPKRRVGMLVLQYLDEVLLHQRPMQGIWGGLWSLPEFDPDERAACAVLIAAGHGTPGPISRLDPIVHGFTHFQLTMEIALVPLVKRMRPPNVEGPPHMWMPLSAARSAALPAPVKRVLEAIFREHRGAHPESRLPMVPDGEQTGY